MNKGIVMEINESNIIVMTSSGRFDKLPKADRSCEVGEEIVYADTAAPRRKVPPLAIGSGLVAAAVLCFVLITGLQATTAKGEVVAYVSIDINPSIEIGIDSQEIVRDLRGINADGTALIANLLFKGKNLEDVTAAILDKAEQGALAKGEGDIVISSTIVQDKTTLNDEAIADKLRIQVAKHIESAHPAQVKNYEVTAFAAPIEVRNEAKISGVTAGKYAVYLNALNNGTQITIDEIQNKSIHQWAKDNGGMSTLVDPVKPITKSALKILVDEEKSGKLAEKAQEKDKNNNNKTDNNTKNNDNNSSKSNQDNKINQNGKTNPMSNKNSSWSDFLLNRGNINSNNDTKTGNTNNDNNGNTNNGNNKKDTSKNDTSKNSNNNKNGSSNVNDSSKITDQNGNTNKITDNNGNTNKNNGPNKDNNKSDSYKNGDNQKGGSSLDNPGASLKPSPSNTPSPKPKPKDGNNSNSDGSNKSQQDNKKQGDSNQGDNNGRGN
jgi:hypothetical protein